MEIIVYPSSGFIKIETLHIDVDDLVDLINKTMKPVIPFPGEGTKYQIREGYTKTARGWGIYIPLNEAGTNVGFAQLICALALRESERK